MQVAVWDTYVRKKDGTFMHFDIVVPDYIIYETVIHTFGKEYLLSKNQEGQTLTAKECCFCHLEKASDEMIGHIKQRGYYIIEMENCE